jgi:DNA-binding MarR family transcriptional regulator
MPGYPPLNTQVIGQAESALGTILEPVLARTGIAFHEWLVLTVTAANGTCMNREELTALISDARKVDGATVEAAIARLAAAGLVTADGEVALTETGKAGYQGIRNSLDEINARLFDFPAEDLATAGRVLAIVTSRANAVLAGQQTPAAPV